MANRKEGYDEKIIECAQKEFLEKGYNDASLRTIAGAAGVSTSTIYTRFNDKKGLFVYLTSPTEELYLYMDNTFKKYFSLSVDEQNEKYEETGDAGCEAILDMIYSNYPAYKLLITRAPGDMFKEYLDRLSAIDVKCTMMFLEENNSRALREGRINEAFAQVLTASFYSAVFQCVERDMSKEEAALYLTEIKEFYRRGWVEYFKS